MHYKAVHLISPSQSKYLSFLELQRTAEVPEPTKRGLTAYKFIKQANKDWSIRVNGSIVEFCGSLDAIKQLARFLVSQQVFTYLNLNLVSAIELVCDGVKITTKNL